MPSRKLKHPCSKCGFRNEYRSKFCNQCGSAVQSPVRPVGETPSAESEHRDIAHPITQSFREYLQKKVLEAYEKEKVSDKTATGSYSEEIDSSEFKI